LGFSLKRCLAIPEKGGPNSLSKEKGKDDPGERKWEGKRRQKSAFLLLVFWLGGDRTRKIKENRDVGHPNRLMDRNGG